MLKFDVPAPIAVLRAAFAVASPTFPPVIFKGVNPNPAVMLPDLIWSFYKFVILVVGPS